MNQEDKQRLVQGMFSGADLSGAQINVFVESGAKVVYKEVVQTKNETPQMTDEQIVNAIEKNQSKFWAQSSWAVVFCVCRDHLGMPDNMTEFERYLKGLRFTQHLAFDCPDGTIQRTIANNPYMKLSISKWKANGGKERAIVLAENLISNLDEKTDTF